MCFKSILHKVIEERLRLMTLLEDSSIIIDLRTNNGFQEIYTGTSLISILIRGHDFISSRDQKLIPLNYTSRKQNPDIPTLLEEFEKMAISLENNSDQTARTQIYHEMELISPGIGRDK
ncbi:unnamed protein product [Rhizophagus irregularis]|nr:unnamed protein product [Rhizophagus irregularis]